MEVIALPVNDKAFTAESPFPDSDDVKPVKYSAFGRLKAYANPFLIAEENGAWKRATIV
jgi:hypothetical protein